MMISRHGKENLKERIESVLILLKHWTPNNSRISKRELKVFPELL